MTRQIATVILTLAGLAGCSRQGSVATLGPSTPSPPTTTSSIWGFVSDTGFRTLPGALVEVIDGPQAGLSTTADATGQFSLSGTFDSRTRFRASSPSHVTATQTWSCSVSTCSASGARPWLGFYLRVLVDPVNISGEYTLTLAADSACVDLPVEWRTRTYAASIAPAPRGVADIPAETLFHVTVNGPRFLGSLNGFDIGVAGDYLDLFLDGGHDPPVVEQLAEKTYLAFSGNATTSVGTPTTSMIAAPLDGWIEYCVASNPMSRDYDCSRAAVTRAHCDSTNHRLILTRR